MDGLMLTNSSIAPVILDLMGYDACAATYALTKIAAGLGDKLKNIIMFPPILFYTWKLFKVWWVLKALHKREFKST